MYACMHVCMYVCMYVYICINVGEDDIPSELTDINERNEWFEDNIVFWNRYVEFEDLLADQQHTAKEKAQEILQNTYVYICI